MSALLEVEDLHVLFRVRDRDVRAVNGLSYTLGEGETVAILGESGSGDRDAGPSYHDHDTRDHGTGPDGIHALPTDASRSAQHPPLSAQSADNSAHPGGSGSCVDSTG